LAQPDPPVHIFALPMCNGKHSRIHKPKGDNSSSLRKSLSLCHWNVEGLQSKSGRKTNDPDFVAELSNFDIVTLTETHSLNRNSFSLSGFCDPFEGIRTKHPKAKKGSGGTAILVKTDIRRGVAFHQSRSPDLIWVQLKKDFFHCPSDIFIGVVYVSPINSSYSLSQESLVWDELSSTVETYQNIGKVMLVGDFNTRTGSLSDFVQSDDNQFTPVPDSYITDDAQALSERLNSDKQCCPKDFVDSLLNICKSSGLRILNGRTLGDLSGKFTCHKWNGSSQVDYGIAHYSLIPLIQYFKIHDHLNHLSDHCKLSLRLNIAHSAVSDDTKLYPLPTRLKWSEQSLSDFKEELLNEEAQKKIQDFLEAPYTSQDIDSLVANINEILVTAAETATGKPDIKHIAKNRSKKPKRIRHKKWFDLDCKSAKDLLNTLGKKLVRDPKNTRLREHFFKFRKEYKGLLKHKARQFKSNLLSAMETMVDQNPQQYWKLMEELKNINSNGAPTVGISPEDLIEHYTALLHKPTMSDPVLTESIKTLSSEPFFAEIDFLITKDEITSKIRSLKSGKAPGLDRISSEMLKASVTTMAPLYTKLFNSIYCHGNYPHSWNTGYIVNIHKGGSVSDPNNYRGITVNSALAKVFGMIINNRLDKYLSDNNTLCPNQIGFRKNARTTDHLFILRTLVDKYVKHGASPLYACFVDFRKAFDSVWRQALLYKLLKYNIRGKMFNIIQDMYRNDSVCLKVDQQRTDFFPCNTGVKQGDVLSPNLFNLFLNDLPSHLSDDSAAPMLGDTVIDSLLYADDLVILSLSPSGLQSSLNKLHSYCQTWKLEVNLDKTKVVKFCKNGRIGSETFVFNNTLVECVKEYKYLGILVTASGSLAPARSNMYDRALKGTFKLKSCTKDSNISPSLALKLFDQVIKPICLYGSEIWGIEDLTSRKYTKENGFDLSFYTMPVEGIQISYCKYTLGVSKKATNAAVVGELGRFPLGVDIIANIMNFWKHANSINANPLLSAAVSVSVDLDLSGKNSWASFLPNLSRLLGETISTDNLCPKRIVKILKRRYVNHWNRTVHNPNNPLGGKLSTYRTFKSNFCFEEYLSEVKIASHRRQLTKLRISNHKLAVETGRFTRPLTPRSERLCNICQSDQVEDESHFLLSCPTFAALRTSLITPHLPSNIMNLPIELQVGYLLNSGGSTIRSVAKYCYQAFNSRAGSLANNSSPPCVGVLLH
jgi:hypothetical protein